MLLLRCGLAQFAFVDDTSHDEWKSLLSSIKQCGSNYNSFACDGSGTRNQIFGCLESAKKWVWGKLNKGFLHFFAKLLAYLMIIQCGVHAEGAAKLSKIIIYVKNLAQDEENTCLKMFKNPFFGWFQVVSENPFSGIRSFTKLVPYFLLFFPRKKI